MVLSSFTENYPAKFAKQVAKTLLFQTSKDELIFAVHDHAGPDSTEDRPTKKRRLGNKMSLAEIAQRFACVNCPTVMRRADQLAPRVGPMVIENGDIIENISRLCPTHDIKHVVL